MILDHARTELPGQRHRIHPCHGDMAGIQHQPHILGPGVFHDEHCFMLILDLAAQMRMDAEFHAQFLADALAQQVAGLGDFLQVFERRAAGLLARAGIGLLVIAAEPARKTRHVQMIVYHGLTLGRIVEGDAAARRAAGDGGELRADLIHAVLKGLPAVRIIDFAPGTRSGRHFPAIAVFPAFHFLGIARGKFQPIGRGAEGRAENFEIAEADIAGFGNADKGIAFPAATGVGGVADAELLLLGQRSLHIHPGHAIIGSAQRLRRYGPCGQQAPGGNRYTKEIPAIHPEFPFAAAMRLRPGAAASL